MANISNLSKYSVTFKTRKVCKKGNKAEIENLSPSTNIQRRVLREIRIPCTMTADNAYFFNFFWSDTRGKSIVDIMFSPKGKAITERLFFITGTIPFSSIGNICLGSIWFGGIIKNIHSKAKKLIQANKNTYIKRDMFSIPKYTPYQHTNIKIMQIKKIGILGIEDVIINTDKFLKTLEAVYKES